MTSEKKLERLAEAASVYWRVPLHRLRSRDRSRRLSWPRSICFYVACRAGASRQEVGDWWDRDPSTVTYGKQRVDTACELYPAEAKEVEEFITALDGLMDNEKK